ncbi:MAG: EF-P lysine aminoacylase EpmA [Alphaproteobacteria bacterium]
MEHNGPPWWDKAAFAKRHPNLMARGRMARAIRAFFAGQDFLEVETPALQVSPGLEPHLKAFATTLEDPWGEEGHTLYLHTSPEFAMKKLLAAGVPRLYQLARVFRNGERSDLHHPEFTMLEWYRADAGYVDLMNDCIGCVRAAAAAAPARQFSWRGVACDPFAEWERLSVADAFSRHAGIDLFACLGDPAEDEPDPRPLAKAAAKAGVRCADTDRFEDAFFRVMLARIEPELGRGRPTILYDYPLCLGALARAKPDDARVAERFELYLSGVEIANGFGELIDVAEQRRRFDRDVALKRRLYNVSYPVDEDFLDALEQGLPECAGIALGFDRLVMLATGAERIEDVLWAPVARPRED